MVVRRLAGDGPPLVWVHGLGESGVCFETVLAEPALASRAAVVPDLSGYGRSPWPIRPDGLVGVADQLAEWMRRRLEVPTVLVGHSMGGVIGVLLAERHADVVAGLVNVDGNVSEGDCTFSGRASTEELDAFRQVGFEAMREEVRELGADDPAHAGYWASLRLADPATFHRHSRDLVELSRAESIASRMRELGCPGVYVAGVPGGACDRTLELLGAAGVEVELVEPAGHWPFVDRPSVVAEIVFRFADRILGDRKN
jgi:pimeloyl-ACP methyl ester carboxylesterase